MAQLNSIAADIEIIANYKLGVKFESGQNRKLKPVLGNEEDATKSVSCECFFAIVSGQLANNNKPNGLRVAIVLSTPKQLTPEADNIRDYIYKVAEVIIPESLNTEPDWERIDFSDNEDNFQLSVPLKTPIFINDLDRIKFY